MHDTTNRRLPRMAARSLATALAAALAAAGTAFAQAPDGAELYKRACAQCHDTGASRAPNREQFRTMLPDRVLSAMESGSMVTMANNRSAAERRAIAEFVTGKTFATALSTTPSPRAMCTPANAPFNPGPGPSWSGWGKNTSNSRYQDAAGLTAADVPKLKVKWAFAFPGDLQSYAQSTLVGGRLFVGSWGGKVYALNASTGCIHWYFDAGAGVRSAISIGQVATAAGPRYAAFFGDQGGNAYAVDATTGAQIWKTRVDDFPVARVSGSPTLHNGRLYVPVASGEEATGAVPTYECCKFRGSIVALDAATGRQVWKTYMIQETPQPTTKNVLGVQLYGPSGAPVWATPAIDTVKNALYVTTGNNYSDPTSTMSDAFVAMDLDTGRILWHRQMTEKDAYTAACRLPDKTNCAVSNGPDFDFGASPMLVTANGRRMLVAGQKSGIVHALDPDRNGEVLWQTRVGRGGTMGGVQWGTATDGANVYVANSDIGRLMLTYSNSTDADPKQGGGMFALRLSDGERVWYTPPASCGARPRCSPAQSAAVSAIPGVAFSGSVDGHMRAYSTADGTVVWDVNTIDVYEGVNGVLGRGGSLDGPGPAIGGGMVFVNSGYPTAGGTPGNVILAYSVDGK
jgi:polyvinyl alcohol dehydrogenase (cytochrome)